MTDEHSIDRPDSGTLDPGAYIGSEPEREADTIPGGVGPKDERVAAYDSQPGLPGEPADDSWSEGQSDQTNLGGPLTE